MIHTPIIPDRKIIRILPSMSDLKIMIIHHESQKPVQYAFTLPFCKSIDFLHMVSESEDALPASDGVGAYDGVDGFEDFADVFGGAAGRGIDLEAILLGCFVEFWLRVGCC
jgi:hypothetical protein